MQQTTISSSTISTTSLASSSVAHEDYVSISLSYKVLHAYRHTITILQNSTSLSSCIASILRTSFSDNLHVPRTRVLPIALLWPPYVIGQAIIFLPCGFFFLSIFFFRRLISAAADWMSTVHMVWPYCEFRMQV